MSENQINISKRFHSIERGVNIVANADEIYDNNLLERLQNINSTIIARLQAVGNGESAYELAVKRGYLDTEEHWLESLVGKSAYEVWRDAGNEGNIEVFLASLKESGFTTQAVTTRPSASNADANTIYAVPAKSDDELEEPDIWKEWICVDGEWKLLAVHDGSGLSSALTDIANLKGRDEPIVFTESKELNRCIKKLFVDISGFNGNYDGGGTGELLNLYIRYSNSTPPYLELYADSTGSNRVVYIGLNGSGIYNAVYANGIYYYLEIDEQLLPSATSAQRSKLTSWATNKANDTRTFDGGFTQANQINKYVKKLWVEFADDYTLPSGYNSLDDLKADIRLYNISCSLSDSVYIPKITFRLKSDYSTEFFKYQKSSGSFDEVNYTANGITLHALVDWEGLKGKNFNGLRMPLNPTCFDGKFYHDAELKSDINRLDGVVGNIDAYFQGGVMMSTKTQKLNFSSGYIATTLNEEINYTRQGAGGSYASYYVTGLTSEDVGKTYIVTGKNGNSGKLVAKILNGTVIEIKAHNNSVGTETIEVDGTFDALVFNVDTRVTPYSLVMKYQVEEDRVPLIEDFDSLKQTVEEMGGGSVATKRTIKTLHFGNSYTQDSFSYVPPILRNIAPNLDFTIMVAFIGSCTLAKHCANFTGTPQTIEGESETYGVENYSCYVYDTLQEHTQWQSAGSKSVSEILNYTDWDIITFQQYSGQSHKDWSVYFQPFIYKIHKTLFAMIATTQNISQKRVKLGWLLTHSRNLKYKDKITDPSDSSKEINRYSVAFEDTESYWEGTVSNAQAIMDKTGTSIIFPYGTAIQNLRTKQSINALGGYADYVSNYYNGVGGLTADGSHLHEGIGCLCAAYANALVLLREAGLDYISIIGEKVGTNIDLSWLDSFGAIGRNPSSPNTTVIGITPDNVYLAQVAAIAAVKNPFELSFDADGESDKGVTLDDFIPTINSNE